MNGCTQVMLGLEDPFSCRELGGALDCVRVPELVEVPCSLVCRAVLREVQVARRQLVQIQQESSNDWCALLAGCERE